MAEIIAKIEEVVESNGMIDMKLSEHKGLFSPNGAIILRFNGQAVVDLNQAMTGKRVKGGSFVGRAQRYLTGKRVKLIFEE